MVARASNGGGSEYLLWITDRDLVVTWLNEPAARFLGRPVADCVGRSVLAWLPAAARQRCERGARDTIEGQRGLETSVECRMRNDAGRELDVEWTLQPLFGARETVQGFACTARDLADRRSVEQRLAASERRLHSFVEAMYDPLISTDAYGTVLAANGSVERVLGWKPAELVGRNIKLLMPEPHSSHHDEYLAKYRATGNTWILNRTRDFEVLRKDGQAIVCSLSVARADLPGCEAVFTGTFRDVTDVRRAEQQLRDSELRFHGLFDNSFEYLGMLSPDGRVLDANRTALENTGLTRDEVVGRLFWETKWWSWSPELVERVKRGVEDAARGEFVRFEAEHPSSDGGSVEMDFSLKPLRDAQGRVVMLIPEGRNISEIKRAQRAETSMLRALAMVGESAALLAHEIKNPVTAVNVALRAVADQLGEDHKAVLQDLVDRLQRVELMMRRTLSFARPLEVKRAPCTTAEVFTDALRSLATRVAAQKAHVDVRPGEPAFSLVADRSLLEKLIANLVANALEAHGGSAHVVVTAERAGSEIVLAVDDDGPGIPDTQRAALFRPFATTKAEGNGFGLAICRRIAEEHGGTILVTHSALGGARFEVRLPVNS
jgi:PAS domain S-box-containing protein